MCCLIHIIIIIPRHILYLVCLFPCLGLGLFNSYLCDLFFNFSFIFIVIIHISTSKQRYLFLYIFQNISYYFQMTTWRKKANNFQVAKVQPQGIAQVLLNFLPISTWRCFLKCFYKKACIYASCFINENHCLKKCHVIICLTLTIGITKYSEILN